MSTTPSEIASLRVRLCAANEYGIWTGGAQTGKMDSVNATSLLGGLRFWTGALLRANSKDVCEDRCQYDDKAKGKVCALCSIFGCTGLSRAFTFKVDAGKVTPKKPKPITLAASTHGGKDRTYYLRYGYTGEYRDKHTEPQKPLVCTLVPRRPLLEDGLTFAVPAALPTALYLMVKYGTLGAYDQYGCGLVSFDQGEAEKLRALCLAKPVEVSPAEQKGLSLRDFFFFKGKTDPAAHLGERKPDATEYNMCEIRWQIRNALRNDFSKDVRHWFCGILGKNGGVACGTNYALTINSDGHLYGWGHFARSGPGITDAHLAKREDVLNAVKGVLTRQEFAGKTLVWRECDSDRDTVKKQAWPDFYTSLINDAWRQA